MAMVRVQPGVIPRGSFYFLICRQHGRGRAEDPEGTLWWRGQVTFFLSPLSSSSIKWGLMAMVLRSYDNRITCSTSWTFAFYFNCLCEKLMGRIGEGLVIELSRHALPITLTVATPLKWIIEQWSVCWSLDSNHEPSMPFLWGFVIFFVNMFMLRSFVKTRSSVCCSIFCHVPCSLSLPCLPFLFCSARTFILPGYC